MRSLDTAEILKVLDKHGPTWNTEDGRAKVTDMRSFKVFIKMPAACQLLLGTLCHITDSRRQQMTLSACFP